MSSVIVPQKIIPKATSPFSLTSLKNAVSSLFSYKAPIQPPVELALDHTNRATLPKNRFLEAAARVFETSHYSASASSEAPYGYFRARHIIGDCTRFHGGIFVSHTAREAVVIDECYGVLNTIFEVLEARIANCSSNLQRAEYEIFNEVILLVSEVIRINPAEQRSFSEREKISADDKIALDVYITQGFGLDYHQVLLAGYLLEKLAEQKKIIGVVSLDSALSEEFPEEEVLLYTSSSGAVLRFSPNQKRISAIMH